MRWCSILEGVHQETKLSLGTLWSETEHLEHLLLQLSIVNTQRTTTYFDTITYEVVSLGTHLLRMLIEQWDIIWVRHSEWMVSSHQALLLITPLEEREVDNPQALEHVLVTETQTIAHL